MIPQNGVVSEIWHGQKWRRDMDRSCLSPMFDAGGGRHYFVDELASCNDGRLVVPVRWLEDEAGNIWCEAWKVNVDATVHFPSPSHGDRPVC